MSESPLKYGTSGDTLRYIKEIDKHCWLSDTQWEEYKRSRKIDFCTCLPRYNHFGNLSDEQTCTCGLNNNIVVGML